MKRRSDVANARSDGPAPLVGARSRVSLCASRRCAKKPSTKKKSTKKKKKTHVEAHEHVGAAEAGLEPAHIVCIRAPIRVGLGRGRQHAMHQQMMQTRSIASLLFFVGVFFGYYIVTPLSINFLGNYTVSSEVFNDFDLSSYIGLLRASVLASGLIFELPIIIYFLTKVGIVTPKFLSKNRKFALIIVLSLSAIITPPDIVSQIIVSIPLLILYEVSIFISRLTFRNLEKQMQDPT